MNHLANRTIFVTAAASGFGRQLTERAACDAQDALTRMVKITSPP